MAVMVKTLKCVKNILLDKNLISKFLKTKIMS